MNLALLEALNAARAARKVAVVVTDTGSGAQRLVVEGEIAGDPLREALESAVRKGKSLMIEVGEDKLFLTVHVPPARMVIIGAVHISQELVPMARAVGYDPVIVDPRTAFASPERFPGVTLHAVWPQDVLPSLGVDRYTAFLALTHDPKIDDPALVHALTAGCFYVGALGSRKTHAKRVERLGAAGLSEQQIARIHAPIGLNLGAISPAEIAVSILAEIIQDWRKAL